MTDAFTEREVQERERKCRNNYWLWVELESGGVIVYLDRAEMEWLKRA